MKKFVSNISYSLLANIISMIVGVIAVLVFPKFLAEREFAYYQLYLFYMTYAVITSLGWPDGIYLTLGGTNYSEINKKRLGTQFWMMLLSQCIVFSLIFVGALFSQDPEKKRILLLVCFGALIVHARYFLYLILQATNRIKEYAVIIITERLFSVLIGLVFLLLGYRHYYLLILLDVLGRGLSLAVAVFWCRDIVLQKPKRYDGALRETKDYIISGAMVLFATLASTIILGVGRYGIEYEWDIIAFSKVSLTISISNMAVRCINAVGIVMFPTLRSINESRLERIYYILDSCLMLLIFFVLCFFKPLASVLSMWLPKYTDSFRYAAILLPACVYDCKNSLLISTYLKTIRKEATLLRINSVAVLFSLVGTFISVFWLRSIEITVLVMLLSLAFRSCLGELYLKKYLGIKIGFYLISELAMAASFVLCNWFLESKGSIIFCACFIVFSLLTWINCRKKNINFPYITEIGPLL